MKSKIVLVIAAILLMGSGPVSADIYHWVDQHGVPHFSNTPPPPNVKVVSKANEIPYDAKSDAQRRKAEDASLKAFLERENLAEQARMKLRAQRLAAETARLNREAAEALLRDTATAAQPVYEVTGGGYWRPRPPYHRPRPCLYGTESGCQDVRPPVVRPPFQGGFTRNPQDRFFLSKPAYMKPLFSSYNQSPQRYIHDRLPPREPRRSNHGMRRNLAPLRGHASGIHRLGFHR